MVSDEKYAVFLFFSLVMHCFSQTLKSIQKFDHDVCVSVITLDLSYWGFV